MPGTIGTAGAHFEEREHALAANLTEANATGFWSATGIIEISIRRTAGTGATAGVITVYHMRETGDAVYIQMPGALYSLICNDSRISPPINLGGPGWYKLVVSAFAGTMTWDLLTRDCRTTR